MPAQVYDPRAIANLLLDEADAAGIRLSNLALQKLLYFCHGQHLIEEKRPLVSDYFEAWQYGPVHPVTYKAFRDAGSAPISFRAERQNILTGECHPIPSPSDAAVVRLTSSVIGSLGRMSPGRLVDLSHAPNSPWHFIVDKGRTSIAFGLRISDDVIIQRFKFHKVSIGPFSLSGEPSEDEPFA